MTRNLGTGKGVAKGVVCESGGRLRSGVNWE